MNARHVATAWALLAAAPCLASVRWAGDFESGDLSQYSNKQIVSGDRMKIVSDPVRQGRHALRVLVKHGDDPIHSSGNRNELAQVGGTPEGTEAYYRWSTMFDPSFPSVKTWQLFAQWHQPEDCCGSPPIQLYVYGEEMRMTVSTAETEVWRAPLKRGVWNDFVLHVKFSDDPKVGFVELWHDGKRVVPKTFAATRANDYLKLGLYRNATVQQDGIVFHDGMVRGDTLADVESPTEVASSVEPPEPKADTARPPGEKPRTHGRTGTGTRHRPPKAEAAPRGCSCAGVEGAPLLALGLLAGWARRGTRRGRQVRALGR